MGERVRAIALVALLVATGVAMAAHRYAGIVVIDRPVNEDTYAAARSVDASARIDGDFVAVARTLATSGVITGDVALAGENVTIGAAVGDDVRAAGRYVAVDAPVGGHVAAAAGDLVIGSSAEIGDRVWAAASDIRVEGWVRGDVEVATGNLVLAGRVDGDVRVRGGEVHILESAHIGGRLIVTSTERPDIDSRAKLVGGVQYTPMKPEPVGPPSAVPTNGFVAAIAVMLLALVPYLVFPKTSLRFAEIARRSPLLTLGIGLAVFAATPVVIVALVFTRVGLLLAVGVLALYLLLLTLAIGAATLLIANLGLRVAEHSNSGRGFYVFALVIAAIAIGVVGLIPYVGPLLLFVLFLIGVGAVSIRVWRGLRGHALP